MQMFTSKRKPNARINTSWHLLQAIREIYELIHVVPFETTQIKQTEHNYADCVCVGRQTLQKNKTNYNVVVGKNVIRILYELCPPVWRVRKFAVFVECELAGWVGLSLKRTVACRNTGFLVSCRCWGK